MLELLDLLRFPLRQFLNELQNGLFRRRANLHKLELACEYTIKRIGHLFLRGCGPIPAWQDRVRRLPGTAKIPGKSSLGIVNCT